MNSFPQGPALPPQAAREEEDDSINLLNLLDVVIDQRLLIAGVTAVAVLFGGLYAYMATPIFEANSLIQIEDSKSGGLGSVLAGMDNAFNNNSPSSAEIEILRSRLVVGQAVNNLQLSLSVSPKYLPMIGVWLSRRATEPSEPGFMGMDGYVRGNESLTVGSLQIPPALEGHRFSVVLTASGYELRSPDGDSLGQGLLGKPLTFTHERQTGTLLVAGAVGHAGAEFYVMHGSSLGATQGLQGALEIIEQGRQSGMLRISLQGANPARTATILNEIGTLYMRQNVNRKGAEAEKSIDFLNSQLPQLRKELESSEGKFNQFRNQHGIFDLSGEASAMLSQTVGLRVNLRELQQKRKELATRFTDQHPTLQVLDAQLKELNADINSIERQTKSLPNVEQDLLRLSRDVKVNNELYTGLLNSFQQLRLIKEGKVGNVRIVDTAVVPLGPIKPQRSKAVVLAGLLGLLAGLASAFVRNSLRPGIKNPEDIEQHLGINVFATVPHSPAQELLNTNAKGVATGLQLLAQHSPEDPSVESLRSLRTALQFAMLDAPNNVVLLTGPTPSVGKSFISANFAAVLSAGGKRVLLIDADMRKGHIHKSFGLPRGRGLSELITGSQTLEQVLHKNVIPQLDLITTGTLPPNPAELLMSPATVQLLQTLSDQYDIVLIDTPPVLAVSDTQVIASAAGTVFLVAREATTSLGELQESSKRLAQSGVAVRGVLLNGVNIIKRRYGDGGGYGFKYSRYRYTNYKYGKSPQG
jgi:tyrosine-protein kinase Etk/Wzc